MKAEKRLSFPLQSSLSHLPTNESSLSQSISASALNEQLIVIQEKISREMMGKEMVKEKCSADLPDED